MCSREQEGSRNGPDQSGEVLNGGTGEAVGLLLEGGGLVASECHVGGDEVRAREGDAGVSASSLRLADLFIVPALSGLSGNVSGPFGFRGRLQGGV